MHQTKEEIILKYPLGTKPDELLAYEISKQENLLIKGRYIGYIRKKHKIPPAQGLYLFQEGIVCVSKYEAMYDAYLHEYNIPHTHQVYLKTLRVRPDFYINNEYFVEITGMIGYSKYDQKLSLKKKKYKTNNISVIFLTKEEVITLFELCKKYQIIYRQERACSLCGKKNQDLVQGICRGSCYSKMWRQTKYESDEICQFCRKKYKKYMKNSTKFCSHKCYSNSLKFEMPNELWFLRQKQSIHSLALEMGIKPSTIYMRLKRFKDRNPNWEELI